MKFIFRYALAVTLLAGCSQQSENTEEGRTKLAPIIQNVTLSAEAQTQLDKLVTEAREISIMVSPERARELFKEILDFAETNYPKTSRRYNVAVNDYGAILNITGSPKQALAFHKKAVVFFETQGTGTETSKDDLSRALANLAETHVRLNQLKKGREIYQRAYDTAPKGLSAHPGDIASGKYPLLIAANWREFFRERQGEIFVGSSFTESKEARAEANRADRFARAQDLGGDPDVAFKAWMQVLPAMQAAYPARSRKVLIATGNRGAVLGYFGKNEEAKKLQNINIQGSLFYGSEILEDAENMSRKLGNLGWASARLNEMNKAEEYFKRSHEIVVTKLPAVNKDLGETHRSLAYIANWRGDYKAAIYHAEAGVKANQAGYGEKNSYTLHSRLDLSRTYSAAGLPVKAEAAAREALGIALDFVGPENRTTVSLQVQMAAELSRQGRYYEAKKVYEEALAAERRAKGENRVVLIDILVGASENLAAMGKGEAAVVMAEEAAKLAPEFGGDGSAYHTNALLALAKAYQTAGAYEDGLKAINEAIAYFEEDIHEQTSSTLVSALSQKVRLLVNMGESERAQNLLASLSADMKARGQENSMAYLSNRILEASLIAASGEKNRALKIAWPLANQMSGDVTRLQAQSAGLAQDSRLYREAFEHMLSIAVLAGDDKKAFWAAQQLLQSSASQAGDMARRRAALPSRALKDKLREMQDLVQQLSVARTSFSTMVTRDKSRASALQSEMKALERQIAKSQGALQKAEIKIGIASARVKSLRGIQSALSKNEAALLLAEGPEFLHTILITKKAVRADRARMSAADVHSKITGLRKSLSADQATIRGAATDALLADLEFNPIAAHDLYRAVFSAEDEDLLKGITHLKVAANGAFSRLPLAVLITGAPKQDVEHQWLIKRFSLSTLVSVSDVGGANKRAKTSDGFLGVGAPVLSEKAAPIRGASRYFMRGGVDVKALSALPSLPFAEREIASVAKILGQENTMLLTGKNADEATLKSLDIAQYGVILFSTHGLVSGELTGLAEPALVLTPPETTSIDNDGLLTATEISRLDLNADWVILSACNTAAGDSKNAPGLTGLARAFIYAGSGSLLVSHWPVRDDAAAHLITKTVEGVANKQGRAEALRGAMLSLMADQNIPNASHPAVWAPFVLAGN